MRLMSFTCWEGIFATIRNLFHIFMFYILKSTCLYRSRNYFFLGNIFNIFRNGTSRKCPKYSSKYSEIFWNNFWNIDDIIFKILWSSSSSFFAIILEIFEIFFKNFGIIPRYFPKYFPKFSKFFRYFSIKFLKFSRVLPKTLWGSISQKFSLTLVLVSKLKRIFTTLYNVYN